MAYKVIILYRLYMPSYFLGTFTEYPYDNGSILGGLTEVLTFQWSLETVVRYQTLASSLTTDNARCTCDQLKEAVSK